jgi:hypothetical protein
MPYPRRRIATGPPTSDFSQKVGQRIYSATAEKVPPQSSAVKTFDIESVCGVTVSP